MQRIEFSEMTNRLHRNMIASAAIIISILFFHIRIVRAAALGVEFENLSTRVLLAILVAFLIYHAVAFLIRAFEEYRIWELQLTAKQAAYFGGNIGTVDLADRLHNLSTSLQKLLANRGAVVIYGQEIFTSGDAEKLKAAADAALIYARRFTNFPTITRIRFWAWDIGFAAILTLVAVLFVVFAWPSV